MTWQIAIIVIVAVAEWGIPRLADHLARTTPGNFPANDDNKDHT